MRKYTAIDIMKLKPCYEIQRVEQLWDGREALSLIEICRLSIRLVDIIWVVSRLLPERSVRLYACDCAEHVLHLFELEYPADERPRRCIDTARRYANGNASQEELDAARDAAWAATNAATCNAAKDTARAAAWSADYDDVVNATADAAARAAADAAARAAAYAAARDVGWGAARDAVRRAARIAARDVARDVEQEWQLGRLIEYVTKTVADSMKERGHA